MPNLIGFLIVLSLSLFLVTGAYRLLIQSRQEMYYQLAQMDLMQTEAIVGYELQRAVAESGQASCGQVAGLEAYQNLAQDQAKRIRLAQGTAVQAFPIAMLASLGLERPGSGQGIADTDVLLVRGLSHDQAVLTESVSKNSQTIKISRGLKIKPGEVVVISDCQHLFADRVISVESSQQEIGISHPIEMAFSKGAKVNRYEFKALYVGLTLRHDANGHVVRALYIQDTQGRRHELIPNISQLKFIAWQKPFHQPGQYLNIDSVTDWSKVKGLQAKIALQSEDAKLNHTQILMLSWN